MEPASKTLVSSTQSNISKSKPEKPLAKPFQLLPKPSKTLNRFPFNIKLKHSELLFKVENDYPDVIKELKLRGWRDSQITSERPLFLWSKTSKIFKTLPPDTIVNHFFNMQELSQKIRLCENFKKGSESFFPKCYKVENCDISEFLEDYQMNQMESQLRLSVSSGNLSIYQQVQENLDMLKLTEGEVFKDLKEITEFLKKRSESDPQFNIKGSKNLWIVKPGWMSRGRGIKLFKDLPSIQNYTQEGLWVIQKYIENPLLINNRKFDIRVWVLLTSTSTISAYLYIRPYLRFSSEEYNAEDTENLFIHLTNNSIVKYSQNFCEEESMWHNEKLQNWIISETGNDLWPSILGRIREIVERTIVEVKGKIGKRRNCFEHLGYDFMLDNEFKPWLIEVNSSPAMDYSTVLDI